MNKSEIKTNTSIESNKTTTKEDDFASQQQNEQQQINGQNRKQLSPEQQSCAEEVTKFFNHRHPCTNSFNPQQQNSNFFQPEISTFQPPGCFDVPSMHHPIPSTYYYPPDHHHFPPNHPLPSQLATSAGGLVSVTSLDGTTYFHQIHPQVGPVLTSPTAAQQAFVNGLRRPCPFGSLCSSSKSEVSSSTPVTSLSLASSSCCSSPLPSSGKPAGVYTEKDLKPIVAAAESVFTSEFLDKNMFLKRKIASNRYGYVSVKLLAQMNVIKRVVKNLDKFLAALRTSQNLQVSPDSTKVRMQNLDMSSLKSSTRRGANQRSSVFVTTEQYSSLLLIGVDDHFAKIDVLLTKFSSFGDILQIRIVPPNQPLPRHLRNYQAVIPELGKVCFIVFNYF